MFLKSTCSRCFLWEQKEGTEIFLRQHTSRFVAEATAFYIYISPLPLHLIQREPLHFMHFYFYFFCNTYLPFAFHQRKVIKEQTACKGKPPCLLASAVFFFFFPPLLILFKMDFRAAFLSFQGVAFNSFILRDNPHKEINRKKYCGSKYVACM